MVQVSRTLIIYCLMIFPSFKSKNDLIIGITTSKKLETTLFQYFICLRTLETNFQATLQQWQNHGSSIKNNLSFIV